MTRYLVGVDSTETAERLVEYLTDRVTGDDTVYVINSLHGGDQTSDEAVVEGREATEVVEEGLVAEVDAHQIIRGNTPQEDILAFAEEHPVEEIIIGIRKRSPTGKLVFGSTAQDLLLSTNRPTVVVPLAKST